MLHDVFGAILLINPPSPRGDMGHGVGVGDAHPRTTQGSLEHPIGGGGVRSPGVLALTVCDKERRPFFKVSGRIVKLSRDNLTG